ncbi:MAG: hypothetical protein JEZ03_16620, partial [Bacteroidales bacterium]|nr:hypothetical protein [Bacteroidales bacterium]
MQLRHAELRNDDTDFSIGTNWLYHAGDNMEWVDSDFDDTSWDTLNIAFNNNDLTNSDWIGIGWFRKVILIDSNLSDYPLAMDFYGIGAFELYLNGRLIHKEGCVSSSASEEEVVFRTKFNRVIVELPLEDNLSNILAVRMSNFHSLQTHYLDHGGWIGMIPSIHLIKDIDYQYEMMLDLKRISNNIYFFIGFIAVLLILHLIIYIFNPAIRANLYFVLFVILLSTTPVLSLYLNEITKIDEYYFFHSLYILNNLTMGLMLLRFMYSVFYDKVPFILWFLIGSVILYVPISFIFFGDLINATNSRFTHLFYSLLAFEMSRMIFVAFHRRNKNSWIIGMGGVLCVSMIFYVIVCDVLFKSYIMEYSEYLGFLFFLISMSIYLALEFVNTQKLKNLALVSASAKGQFLANMSHELRTPMNSIIGFTDLTLSTHLDKKQNFYLKTIEKSAKSLLLIINNILDYSKLEAEKLSLEKVPFDLEELIISTLNSFNLLASNKGVELNAEFNENVPFSLIGDPMRLEQVLNNICGNAVKFTEKGEVRIIISSLENDANTALLQFEIIDTGIGMDKHLTDKVFDLFSQAELATSRKYGGSGLGLAISRKILQLMGGEIYIESELNKGSTVIFRAPFTPAEVDRRSTLKFENFQSEICFLICNTNVTKAVKFHEILSSFGLNQIDVCTEKHLLKKILKVNKEVRIALFIDQNVNENKVLLN